MNRRINIIDYDEVARAMAASSQTKGNNSPVARKVAGSSTSTPVRPNKISSVPAARKEPRAPVTAIPSQHLRGQLYKANGLKILLNDQDGLGDKKRQHARLAKSLLHNDLEKLLDIVEQYAGTEKQIEFCILELSKVEVATWIEQKETLALGRHPKSTLPSKSQIHAKKTVAPSHTPAAPTLNNGTTTPSVPYTKKNMSHTAVRKDTREQPDSRKRRIYEDEPDGQPPQKLQKLQKQDTPEEPVATADDHQTDAIQQGNSSPETVSSFPQISEKINTHKVARDREVQQMRFMSNTGMDPSNLDLSTTIVHNKKNDRVLTATTKPRTGAIQLFDTTVPRNTSIPPMLHAPFLKQGIHSRHGAFVHDPDRNTGHGHQITPNDRRRWNDFIVFNGMWRCHKPHSVSGGEAMSAEREIKETWEKWQIWYGRFVEKYPGYAVAHLWPCGCEKAVEGDESDEE
ncbi:hypothetical protein COCSADRAFT_345256 [Bipolaris sorokiniana ND90Pr]|uniref:Uncharacterized protein n=1 Tax=Cochliobolus sativus (strain ND90Pr / ATCC 201652) TaxID=665912 RepID=M2SFD1_COCSN|nr:uncharacterized protein COCSADRAFT_345256 [Bipolaris sorokiniana ND90Pr]EMD61125.1 hypothetical protein COCSADRAFT_345256 [Bipolaris sorokiniana ND90Pr]